MRDRIYATDSEEDDDTADYKLHVLRQESVGLKKELALLGNIMGQWKLDCSCDHAGIFSTVSHFYSYSQTTREWKKSGEKKDLL
jgi:hypothetical protein